MSRETLSWLNSNTLIGCPDKRGTAWHWRATEQNGLSNHYPGPIPIGDVQDRLFHWTADSRRIAVETPTGLDGMTHRSEKGLPARWAVVPDRQAICRSDTDSVMGIFGPGYSRHQYREWLLTTVADLLDDDLAISSAGLLRAGAVAWVEVSMPDTITTPEGVAFRPNLLATTSFDGSSATTTYKRTVTDTVCANTRDLALAEAGQEFKVKHSRHSRAQLGPARQALQMVRTLAADFAAEVAQMCATAVTDQQWHRFLDAHIPRVEPQTGRPLHGRALTMAERKRDTLQHLYAHDVRVTPWAGTAHGVLQAVNTYAHHHGIVRGDRRAERNQLKTLTGAFAQLDRTTLRTLTQVLQRAA